ncbi:MAG: hypothetical protein M1281_11260 [Chloroflexi bacterium]|nr:hypothetical protein [Chloroflexota bacterium]
MKLIHSLTIASIILGSGLIIFGFVQNGYWPAALGLAILGGFWVYMFQRKWWLSPVALFVLVGGGVTGIILGETILWTLLGTMALLLAWDLNRFYKRINVQEIRNPAKIVKQHLRILGMINGFSLLFIGMYYTIRLQLSFTVIFFLAVVSVWSLAKTVQYLLQKPDIDQLP